MLLVLVLIVGVATILPGDRLYSPAERRAASYGDDTWPRPRSQAFELPQGAPPREFAGGNVAADKGDDL